MPALLEIAEESDALPRRMAIVALTRMATGGAKEPAWQKAAVQVLADAVFAGGDDAARARAAADAVTHAAVAGLAAMAADRPRAPAKGDEVLAVPEGALDVDAMLDEPRAQARSRPRNARRRSCASPSRCSGPRSRRAADVRIARARAVLDALGSGEGELAPFVARGQTGPAAEKARAILAALEPSLVPLARHPDPVLRTKAILLVARSSSDAAVEAVVAGLADTNEAVQRVALAAVGATRADGKPLPASARAVQAVGGVLAAHESWAMRVLAAQAMGRLGRAGAGPEAARRLSDAATRDPYALVRQAALEAYASFDAAGVRALAARVASGDAEPRVREAAQAIASGQASRAE